MGLHLRNGGRCYKNTDEIGKKRAFCYIEDEIENIAIAKFTMLLQILQQELQIVRIPFLVCKILSTYLCNQKTKTTRKWIWTLIHGLSFTPSYLEWCSCSLFTWHFDTDRKENIEAQNNKTKL